MLLIIIFLGSIFVFINLKGISILKIKDLSFKTNGKDGEITPFNALMNSLAASLGVGNIIGVSQALIIGGPGSIFWMIAGALFGTAIKFAEGFLAIKYKAKKNGEYHGGPMYYIKGGLPKKYHFLAFFYSLFGIFASFGVGNMIQSNSVSNTLSINKLYSGLILAILTFLVIYKGIKGISKITVKIIPFITLFFIVISFVCLFNRIERIAPSIRIIFFDAFSGKAVLGGSLYITIKYGLSRGIFSNESGMGTSAIAHGASTGNNPYQEGLLCALDNIIDTIILCSLTALVILTSDVCVNDGGITFISEVTDINIAYKAYLSSGGIIGGWVIYLSIILLGFATIIGWYYYGEQCYLFVFKNKRIYQIIYVFLVFLGANFNPRWVWKFSEICNNLMTLPNLLAIIILLPTIKRLK